VARGSSACLTRGGLRGEHAVAAAVLEALPPAGVPAAVEALEQVGTAHDPQRPAVPLARAKARYEAQRAPRPYAVVAPAHRRGAGALARRWPAAWERVTALAAPLATRKSPQITLSAAPRQGFRQWGQARRAVGQHPAAPATRKTRLLRPVLSARIITPTQEPPEPLLPRHGPGGVQTAWRVARHAAGTQGRATTPAVLAVIGARSTVCQALPLAAPLQRVGERTGTGNTGRAHRGAGVRDP
jgi:hypothetical protein